MRKLITMIVMLVASVTSAQSFDFNCLPAATEWLQGDDTAFELTFDTPVGVYVETRIDDQGFVRTRTITVSETTPDRLPSSTQYEGAIGYGEYRLDGVSAPFSIYGSRDVNGDGDLLDRVSVSGQSFISASYEHEDALSSEDFVAWHTRNRIEDFSVNNTREDVDTFVLSNGTRVYYQQEFPVSPGVPRDYSYRDAVWFDGMILYSTASRARLQGRVRAAVNLLNETGPDGNVWNISGGVVTPN